MSHEGNLNTTFGADPHMKYYENLLSNFRDSACLGTDVIPSTYVDFVCSQHRLYRIIITLSHEEQNVYLSYVCVCVCVCVSCHWHTAILQASGNVSLLICFAGHPLCQRYLVQLVGSPTA